jgi:hypothetical protein
MTKNKRTSVHIINFQEWKYELRDREQAHEVARGELLLTDKELREKGYSDVQIVDIQRYFNIKVAGYYE